MTDRPIIFSAPMIQALLDGRKTQTRRVIKPTPDYGGGGDPKAPQNWGDPEAWGWEDAEDGCWRMLSEGYTGRPYYGRGMRLWVREAHAYVPASAYRNSLFVEQHTDPHDTDQASIYREGFDRSTGGIRWRPSIHMPRWASRLTLTVTDVRVQRLQEISESDAQAEGCRPAFTDTSCAGTAPVSSRPSYRWGFPELWNSLHGPDAWDANPWVVALTFTVHRGNIDRISA